ncbi:MAG TPA: ABC transporter ATP-binding protein, partial [Burkholderiales bacterium]|nr:ABC transporter ATP-binding protein [Burkholderiales bacterium]
MSAADIVAIEDLRFAYNRREIFRGLSLRIPRGKVVAILGASGCGKTTLLKLIGGQLRPAGGTIRVDGQTVHELDTDAL